MPGKFSKDFIQERRDTVKQFLDKGVMSAAKIAKAIGVSDETIRRDIKEIRKGQKERLSKKAGADHVSDMLGQIEQTIVNSSADYIAIKDNSPRASSVKAQIQQTILRAIALKTQVLMNTGVIGSDITVVDRILEAEAIEGRAREILEPALAEIAVNSESRRKVLTVIEKLKNASPEMRSMLIDELDKADAEDNAKLEDNDDLNGDH